MRTAGKRRKALRARRIRPQDSRFVPVLMDRPLPARRPAPRRALPFALSVSKQALCGDFQEPLPVACQPGHLQKIFFHSLWAFPCPAYAPPAITLQEKSSGHQQTCFPFPSGYGGHPLRASSLSPPSYPLVKQRGAAPPSSSRQAPSWAEAPAPTTAFTKRPPSPAPQKTQVRPRQHQDLIRSKTGNGATRRAPYAPGSPGMVDDRDQQLLRGPSRSKGSPPAKPLALTRTKVFAGWGHGGRGPFPKGISSPGRPRSSNENEGTPLPFSRRLRSCSPLPSGPRLGKDAANKRRWRD